MSRAPLSFKQRDLTRAIKAVEAAGLTIARAEVDKDGKIVIVPGRPEAGEQNELDAWIGKHADAAQGH
jgi:hypothetical protein